MAKSKFGSRVWDISLVEQHFEQELESKGFTIVGLKEYKSGFTDYLIRKHGISVEYRLHRDTSADVNSLVNSAINIWELRRCITDYLQHDCDTVADYMKGG